MASAATNSKDPGLAELRAVQEFMAGALFRPLAPGDRMQTRWKDGRPMKRVTEEVIKPNDRLTSFERLEIYNRVYWFRVLDCLYDDFPAVLALIGRRRFHKLITAYLAEFPSRSYTLRDLGERLPGFIQAQPQWTDPYTNVALEAATFEWAQVVAFDGEARPALGVDVFLGADPSSLRLGIQPYLTLLHLQYGMDEFVLALRKAEEVRGGSSNTMAEAAVRKPARRLRAPRPESVCVAVHRYENSMYYKRLEPAAFAILEALNAGEPLAVACARGAEAPAPKAPLGESIQKWFHDWTALGWICTPD